MYPEYTQYNNQQPAIDKRVKFIKWAAIIIPIVLIVLAIIYFATRPSYVEFNVSTTDLESRNDFGYVHGTDLYAYNGMVFYKQNVTNGDITVLSEGQRLPKPEDVYWANDKGALMKFSGSYALTAVEDHFNVPEDTILLPQDVENYTWYYDFATGDLNYVTRASVIPETAYYSEQDGGMYFIGNDGVGPTTQTPLYFYDTNSQKLTQMSFDLNVTDMTHVGACPSEMKGVCFTARDNDDTSKKRVYNVTRDSEKKNVLFESDGQLFPTNNPNYYLTASYAQEEEAHSHGGSYDGPAGDVSDADASDETPVVLHNLTDDSSRTLDFTTGLAEPSFYFLGEDKFYVLHSNTADAKEKTIYRSGELTGDGSRSEEFTLTSDGKPYEGVVNTINSQGSDGITLATNLEDRQILFTQTGEGMKTINVAAMPDAETAKRVVEGCMQREGDKVDYYEDTEQFVLLTLADNNFQQRYAQYAQCIADENPKVFYGYRFQLAGYDPGNGRVSTD